jgi:hypothetical protein
MKIIPERVTVLPDMEKGELTILMEGFRITLSGEEARALGYALTQGVRQLYPDHSAVRPPATAGFAGKAAPMPPLDAESATASEFRTLAEAAKQKGERTDPGAEARRSLTA